MASEESAHRKRNNYKLLVDPDLQKGQKKLYRVNGAIPGYDKYWQGPAPERDVFVIGLSDAGQAGTLREACSEIGPLHVIKIHRHPKTKAFLGAATMMFAQTGCGKKAVEKLDGKIVAGCYLRADLDDKGEHLKNYLEPVMKELRRPSTDKKPVPAAPGSKGSGNTLARTALSGSTVEQLYHQTNSLPQNSSEATTPKSLDGPPQRPNLFFSPSFSVQAASSSVIESPSSINCFSPSFTPHTPSSIDSGISLKPSFDPMLALKSLNLFTGPQLKEPPPTQSSTSPSSLLPPLPPSEKSSPLPPPPPANEDGIENISSDEENECANSRPNQPTTSAPLSDLLSPISLSPPPSAMSLADNSEAHCSSLGSRTHSNKNCFKSPSTSVVSPSPLGIGRDGGGGGGGGGGGSSYGIEVEEISGDESPVMVYSTQLHVEQVSSDEEEESGKEKEEGAGDDMEISDDDTAQTNVIEVNVRSTGKSFCPLPQYPLVPPSLVLPPIPPAFPPAPGFFPPPSQPDRPPFLPPLPHHGLLPPGILPPSFEPTHPPQIQSQPLNGYQEMTLETTPGVSWSSPNSKVVTKKQSLSAHMSPERISQDVLVKALEQLASIVRKDLERKMVESAAFPELDGYWEKRERRVNGGDSLQRETCHEPEEKLVKPPEPYRRMLPGMVVGGPEEEERSKDTPITPRKMLLNFKIPLLNRSSHRRSHPSLMARRRLYEEEDREERRREGHHKHRRPSRTFLTTLSDISSEEFSEEEEEEEDEARRRRKRKRRRSESSLESESSDESRHGPRTPSGDSESEAVFETSESEEEEEEVEIEEEEKEEEEEEEEEEWSLKLELKSGRDVKQRRKRRISSGTVPVMEEKEEQVMAAEEKVVRHKEIVNNKMLEPPRVAPSTHQRAQFKKRAQKVEEELLRSFLEGLGPDQEDIQMLRLALTELQRLGEALVADVVWSHYPSAPASPPPSKRRRLQQRQEGPHSTGCARCEGYYKIDQREKSQYLPHLRRNKTGLTETVEQQQPSKSGRGNRLNHRRVASLFSSGDMSREVQQYNQLKARKKLLKFAKSTIHNWGLFALENISADEMVIEYVGELVRQAVADDRERRYEAQGVGSSYLFRVDHDYIIDATRRGNMARFINHCCDPNCYARVISIGAQKKIVIYSKRDIAMGEEITYDYKFPIEDEKIPCLCGAPNCRGTLN